MKIAKIIPTPIETASAHSIVIAAINQLLESGGEFEEPAIVIAEVRRLQAWHAKKKHAALNPQPRNPKPATPVTQEYAVAASSEPKAHFEPSSVTGTRDGKNGRNRA